MDQKLRDIIIDALKAHLDREPDLKRRAIEAFQKLLTDAQTTRMQHLWTLGLLADCSMKMDHSSESQDLREMIGEALDDAQTVITNMKWKRILDRFEIDIDGD
jgi:hypothetical protein